MKNLFLIIFLLFTISAFAQKGQLQGIVTDIKTEEPLMFATVLIKQKGTLISGAQTDFDGKYSFDSLKIGTYEMEVSYVGFSKKTVKGIVIGKDKIIVQNIKMEQESCCCVIVMETYPLLINYWDLTQGTTFSADEIRRSPHKN
jgi:hypothetical protein